MTIIYKEKLTVLTATMLLMFVLATVACAASQTVDIDSRYAKHSGAISSLNGAKCNGYNYQSSEDRLFMVLEYSDGGGWANEAVTAMQKGGYGSLSSSRSGNLLWRVTLNPDEFAHCKGYATVENR
ncbi:MAG: hypothetical protein M0P20_01790 [Methanocorpusculum sp.]|nr:hypothetical protein [Methanocorpusculum sp.]